MTTDLKEEHTLSEQEMANIENAVIAKYGTNLKPGEWLSIDVKQDKTHCHATIFLEMKDQAERLELEAVVLDTDNSEVVPALNMSSRFDYAIDFLDSQLERFFENERFERFHDDWRLYDFLSVVVRFRGANRNVEIERLADEWLKKAEE